MSEPKSLVSLSLSDVASYVNYCSFYHDHETHYTIDGPCIAETYVILQPEADYPNTEVRDNYLSAMKEVFSHEVDTNHVDWTGSGDPNTNLCGSGTNPENYQTNYIGMNRFVGDDLQSRFTVKISNPKNEDCGKVMAAFGAAVGWINGIAGGFFGALGQPACQLITG